jgi:hypothetical protein
LARFVNYFRIFKGLGERLGYHGIKVSWWPYRPRGRVADIRQIALPVDVLSDVSFIQHYIEFILAYQVSAASCCCFRRGLS